MPAGSENVSNSFGELPASPERAALQEKRDVTLPSTLSVLPNPVTVIGVRYVKKADTSDIPVANERSMNPPSSTATFSPERGGKSHSLREMPAVKTVAPVNVTP